MKTDKNLPSPDDIRLFLTDVDGTLTDGGMYYGMTWDLTRYS